MLNYNIKENGRNYCIFIFFIIIFCQNATRFFDKYKSIFTQDFDKTDYSYEDECQRTKSLYISSEDSFHDNCIKCMKYLEYLEKIYTKTADHEKGITYLYLWLYDNELHKNTYNIENSLDLYEKLLKSYNENLNSQSNIEQTYKQFVKSELDNNMHKLYYLYYKFYILKSDDSCKSTKCEPAEKIVHLYNTNKQVCDNDDNTPFCNELYNFADQYNAYIKENNIGNGDQKYLVLTRNNYISVIITPIFITLVVSSILFILYKFTSLGSCFRFRKNIEKKKWDNIDKELCNEAHTYEAFNRISKKPHSISYHSVEHNL
ncbi:PIR protein [Plasmodium vivax]|nr:PIR protein [Plasmodium vivax]